MSEKIWQKNYPKEIPLTIDYKKIPLYQLLVDSAQAYPNNQAIYFLGKEITFKELLKLTKKFANALSRLGVKKGNRVALMLPNSPQDVIAYYAIQMLGAIVVQTNPMYTERELEHQLIDAQAETIIVLDLMYPKVEKVKSVTALKNVIVTSIKDYLPFPKNLLYPLKAKKQGQLIKIEYKEGIYSFVELIKSAQAEITFAEINPLEDIAVLQYTGGTTGISKGVMLTHNNLVANVIQEAHWLYKARKGKEKILGALPFFHVYGMTAVMNLAMYLASTMILLPRYDVKEILKTIEKVKPTFFPGAPTMYIALLNHPELKKYDLSSIEACISGSAPLPVEVQEKFEKITGARIVEGYGLSETSPIVHANPVWDRRKNGSIGIPWPDTDAKVVDSDGEELPIGEVGELAVKGPQIMKGYWNRPEETSKVLNDGWFLTGDLAKMDEDGYFYIVDRKKDMIIAGGYNIYPREVEEVLYEHPAVKEVVIAGIPDPYRGETVKAYIVLKDGMQVTEEELNKFCRTYLAAYKVPRLYEFRKELPKTTVGKILRRVLVEEEKAKQKLNNEKVEG